MTSFKRKLFVAHSNSVTHSVFSSSFLNSYFGTRSYRTGKTIENNKDSLIKILCHLRLLLPLSQGGERKLVTKIYIWGETV